MGNEDGNSMVKGTIEAVTGLVEAVPVYQDAIQPAAKEVGKSLLTVARLINVALAPISVLVWGYDKIEGFVNERLKHKLKSVPDENIITPDPAIVGPSLEALRFVGNNEQLREMYANLISNSMDTATSDNAHPGFVEIIKNLSSNEAILLNFIGDRSVPILKIKWKLPDEDGAITVYNHLMNVNDSILTNIKSDLVPSYLENLKRLGLIEITYESYLTAPGIYDVFDENSFVIAFRNKGQEIGRVLDNDKGLLKLTPLGEQFRITCVLDKGSSAQ